MNNDDYSTDSDLCLSGSDSEFDLIKEGGSSNNNKPNTENSEGSLLQQSIELDKPVTSSKSPLNIIVAPVTVSKRKSCEDLFSDKDSDTDYFRNHVFDDLDSTIEETSPIEITSSKSSMSDKENSLPAQITNINPNPALTPVAASSSKNVSTIVYKSPIFGMLSKKHQSPIHGKNFMNLDKNRKIILSDDSSDLASVVIKEEYNLDSQIIDEPLVIEKISKVTDVAIKKEARDNFVTDSPNFPKDPIFDHLVNLQELGTRINAEATNLINDLESGNPITEKLEQLFNEMAIKTKELTFKFNIKPSAESVNTKESFCQVSMTDMSMNEIAKEQMLANISDSDEDKNSPSSGKNLNCENNDPLALRDAADEQERNISTDLDHSYSTKIPETVSECDKKTETDTHSLLDDDVVPNSPVKESVTAIRSQKLFGNKTSGSFRRRFNSTKRFKKDQKTADEKDFSDEEKDVLDLNMILSQRKDLLESNEDAEIDEIEVETSISDEEESDEEESDEDEELDERTKEAKKQEEDRLNRLTQKINTNTQLSQALAEPSHSLILDWDESDPDNPKPIAVHESLAQQLKPHQVEGVRFMYESCYGDVNTINKFKGSGCILAHCMGLGKTFQLIALLHTVIRYPKLKTHRILVLCPKSTILNWQEELINWLKGIKDKIQLKPYCFVDSGRVEQKIEILQQWSKSDAKHPSCLFLGYEAFRCLVNYDPNKKKLFMNPKLVEHYQKIIKESLLNPGPDLVVCDEGHIIKNQKTGISKAVVQIKTLRRIILSGTPVQNHLEEYYSMIDFVKPHLLGTKKEFQNRFANPIKSGLYKDSTKEEVRLMKYRTSVLIRKLSNIIHRKEVGVLKQFLPTKHEYVLFVPLSPCQERLYHLFLEKFGEHGMAGKSLMPDYTFLRKIWTHPKVLDMAWNEAMKKLRKAEAKQAAKTMKKFEDLEDDEDLLDTGTGCNSVTNDWWRAHIEEKDLTDPFTSYKLKLLFQIIKHCRAFGEKCLIFSSYTVVLNMVEHFFKMSPDNGMPYPLINGKHYYRFDGSTDKNERQRLITSFNQSTDKDLVCFLISARAGGQGINLTAANRVVILDTSWNPSNDQQNIFRIYRLGQKRPCYIYRLLAMGTMEEKIYSRAVTKQAMSSRVVDKHQTDRHYDAHELAELYSLTVPDMNERETPVLPEDLLLKHLLLRFQDQVYKYHEHESLLENKPEEDLTEREKLEAWQAFEKEEYEQKRQTVLTGFEEGASDLLCDNLFSTNNVGVSSNIIKSLANSTLPQPRTSTSDFLKRLSKTNSTNQTQNKRPASTSTTSLSNIPTKITKKN